VREFRVSAGVSQCGGFHAKPVVIGNSSAKKPTENLVAEGLAVSVVSSELVSVRFPVSREKTGKIAKFNTDDDLHVAIWRRRPKI
jgi:hypothetical protein